MMYRGEVTLKFFVKAKSADKAESIISEAVKDKWNWGYLPAGCDGHGEPENIRETDETSPDDIPMDERSWTNWIKGQQHEN